MKKQLVILGIAVLLICVGLSGCEELSKEIAGVKEIEIDGNGITQTVNNPGESVKLDIFGDNCDITVTEETNLVEIEIFGDFNTVRVSKGHSYESDIFGDGNKIIKYD